MRINITYDNKNQIEGYKNINIEDKASISSLNDAPDYSCEDIIFNESFNLIDSNEALEVLKTVCRKLSVNGKITLNTIDFESLCIDFINGTNNKQATDGLLSKIKHATRIGEVISIINSYNINVSSLEFTNYMANINGEKRVDEQKESISNLR